MGAHDGIATAIEADRAALEKCSQAENARCEKQKHKLELAVRRGKKLTGQRSGLKMPLPARP
jgi:hypothetical protein